jgi:hypothetical protein
MSHPLPQPSPLDQLSREQSSKHSQPSKYKPPLQRNQIPVSAKKVLATDRPSNKWGEGISILIQFAEFPYVTRLIRIRQQGGRQ